MTTLPTSPEGLFVNLASEAYHAGPGLSNSQLNDFARSPMHYWALHRDPGRPPPASRPGQLEGTLAHTLTLEPGTFGERYAVGPDLNRNTNLWKDFVRANPRRTCIQTAQYGVAFAQAESVRAHPELGAFLSEGRSEVSAYWRDPTSGLLLRVRPDWVHPVAGKGVILVDLKTCSDASPTEFRAQCARKGYHRQAAKYAWVYEAASDEPVLGFVFAAVEDAWPYACGACMLDQESMQAGLNQVQALLRKFAACEESGQWPGYADDGIPTMTLPPWALPDRSR